MTSNPHVQFRPDVEAHTAGGMPAPPAEAVQAPPHPRTAPTLFNLGRAWAAIGTQSLGGGASTLYMMRALMVERTGWISPAVFRECWAISQASPGIHFIAMAGLIGERLGGRRGLVVAVLSFLVPASLVTILFTAGLVEIERFPVVQAALRGIVPATGGMTLAMAWYFAQSAARSGRRVVVDILVVVSAAAVGAQAWVPVPVLLAIGALVGAFLLRPATPAKTAE